MVPASTACPSPRRASSRRCAPSGGLPMLRDHPTGSYRFLPGISAFSSGVIAMPGHEIVHATLGTPLPWPDGLALVEPHLRAQGADGIVRRGDTSPDGMREKARFVMNVMQERMRALGADWRRATAIDVYTAQPIHDYLDDILRPAGPAAIHGVRWFPSRPPI